MIHTDGKHTVNAQLAQELLNGLGNDSNRHLKPKTVNNYVADMLSGNWHFNADPIRISKTNQLLDGQHRLNAIVASDTTQELYFILNLEDEVAEGVSMFEVIDQNIRKPHEILAIKYKTLVHPSEVVKLMRKLEAFNDKALVVKPNGYTVTNKSVLAFSDQHQPLDRLDRAVDRGVNLNARGDNIISKDDGAFLSMTIGSCEKGNIFLEQLASVAISLDIPHDHMGKEMALTDPIANLAVVLTQMAESSNKNANTLKARYLQIFKAYEKFLLDESVTEGYRYNGSILPYPIDYTFYNKGL